MSDPRPTLFLADLHLPTQPSPLRERFLGFLHGPAREAAAVYVLGDLFEVWIGDDVGLQDYAAEVAALAALSARGVPIYFQHGNRDFMLGRDFFVLTGVRALPDPCCIELGGRRVLISHGDIFCTDDLGYQRWRRFSRLRWAQWLFMRLSVARRMRISGGIKSTSASAKHNKAESIMDVNPRAVAAAMRQHGVQQLIHGHTHRPGQYEVELGEDRGERIVLPDWRAQVCDYLQVSDAGISRQSCV